MVIQFAHVPPIKNVSYMKRTLACKSREEKVQ